MITSREYLKMSVTVLLIGVVLSGILYLHGDWRVGAVGTISVVILAGWMQLFLATQYWGKAEREFEARQRELQNEVEDLLGNFARLANDESERAQRATLPDIRRSCLIRQDLYREALDQTFKLARRLGLKTRSTSTSYLVDPPHQKKAA